MEFVEFEIVLGTEFAPLVKERKLLQLRVAGRQIVQSCRCSSLLLLAFAFASVALSDARVARAQDTPILKVQGMTFVSTRDNDDTVILHADRARIDTDKEMAYLDEVDAKIPNSDGGTDFRMKCDVGEINLATNDFLATGNIRGASGTGGDFTTDWVRYDHSDGVLSTEASVIIVDDGITYRGKGFHYDIEKRRFRLLGGTSVLKSAAKGIGS